MADHHGDSEPATDDTLLYDLTSLVEWQEEKEVIGGAPRDEIPQPGVITGGVRKVRSSISRWSWATARAVGLPVGSGAPCALPADLVKLTNSQQSWSFAQSNDAGFAAVLQDNCLEIRSSKEDYNTLFGKCPFSKDPYPQWRKVAWSQYSTAVAFSDSDGTVHVCDLKGILLFSYQGHTVENELSFDYSSAICGLVFIGDEVSKHKDTMHLLIASYSGATSCIEISSDYDIGYKLIFTFNLAQWYTGGVSCVLYEQERSLIIAGGCAGYLDSAVGVPKATKYGLTAWRLLSDHPYLKPLNAYAENSDLSSRHSLLRRISTVPLDIGKKFRGQVPDGVFAFALSPCRKQLVVIHLSGSLSLWEVPSLRLRRSWVQTEQPNHGDIDTEAVGFAKKLKDYPMPHSAIDCNWWSDSAVILARCTGALTVLGVANNSLTNLFGEQCEWLEPAPRVSACKNEGFLALECETATKTLKRQRVDTNEDTAKDDDDDYDPFLDNSDNEEKSSVAGKIRDMSKSAMYNLTEMEYFRPPRKRAKLVTKMYRLVSLTKTTSEKLFEKKLEAEEYGEALALAQKYGLDGDRVFQRQWRKSAVSVASIQDYLSKISKKSWVLHECCERVPEELDAARELLKFALQATDLDEMAGHNPRTSISEPSGIVDSDSDYEEYEGFDVEEQRRQEIKHRKKFVQKWSRSLDLNNLTLEQREMIRARIKIFKYLDRLATYEHLLGGYDAARERFNRERFTVFRQQDMLTSAVEYARTCNWRAVETLLTFHGNELRQHRLAILSNFPKTLAPGEYRSLLPEVGGDGHAIPWPEQNHRDPADWCEEAEYQFASSPLSETVDPAVEFYQDYPHLSEFRMDPLTADVVRRWYTHQAIHMDLDARDIEGALDLLKFGAERGTDGLDDLRRDFRTLEVLVYECDYDPGLTLNQVQQKPDLECFQMIMKKSSKEMYIKNLHRWGLPFLKSCEEKQRGLASEVFRQYVLQVSEEDLTFPGLIFTTFIRDQTLPVFVADFSALVELALEAVYLNCKPEHLNLVKEIHVCLTKLEKGMLRAKAPGAQSKIDMLEKHAFTCTMLAKYHVKVTPAHIQEVEKDRNKVHKLFVRLSRTAGSREPGLSRSEWNGLLGDMLKLRERIFSDTCSLEAAVCLEVFVESLLTSGVISNFEIAGERMMRTAEEEHEASRRRLYNAPQKLSYESSVGLVIKSSQEYFDASSPSVGDNMLNLARECLLLITDRPPLIREKLDLIEGVVLLHHFSVDKLPLQVRLTDDRLSLVSKAIEADKDGYKKTEALLRLGMLLRACGSNKTERKGQILVMIVRRALECQDFQSALCLCQELIAVSYTEAWGVCLELASQEQFGNVIAKRDVLEYVACYCDGDRLKDVMDLMCLLECKILQEAIEEHTKRDVEDADSVLLSSGDSAMMDMASVQEQDGMDLSTPLDKLVSTTANFLSPAKMLENTAKGTKAVLSATGTVLSTTGTVLSATSSTTREVLLNVGNKDWWANTINQTLSVFPGSDFQTAEEEVTNNVTLNEKFEHQGCPEFYCSIIDNCIAAHGLRIVAGSYFIPVGVSFNQARLRLLRLADRTKTSVSLRDDENTILSQLVTDVLPYDFMLGIGYLLLVANPDTAYALTQNFPTSALSIQTALYYFSLRFLVSLTSDQLDPKYDLFHQVVPLELIKHAITVSYSAGSAEDKDTKALASYIIQLKEQLYDFSQSEKLHRLGRGIDLERFRLDTEYKEETILGLAMTSDEEQYKLAVSLAHRSGTDLWLVLATHLEFMFTECQDELDATGLHDHIKKLNMVPELVSRPTEFFERMDKHVYPFIGGSDLERLLLYFTLLSECQGGETAFVSSHGLCDISPANHIKMIRKIRNMTPDLDYKGLITDDLDADSNFDSVERVLNILRRVLDNSNVQMFSKLVPKIPYSSHKVTASSLYLEVVSSWVTKGVEGEIGARDATDWIHRYESCNNLLRFCDPNDLLHFFRKFLFTSKFSDVLPHKTRQDIMKRGVKLCKIQGTKERKGQLDEEILENGQSFHTVLPLFITMSKHLDSYSTTFVSNMVKSAKTDPEMQEYLRLYDETQSRPEQILDLASLMLSEGRPPPFIQQFLAVVPGNKWSPYDVLKQSIEGIIQQLANEYQEGFGHLSAVISNISAHEKTKNRIFTSKQVLELLRPFCTDSSVNASLKVDVLKLLEDKFELEDAETKLLLYHRTCAVIRDGWGEKVCSEVLKDGAENNGAAEAVASEDNRLNVFHKLLADDIELSKLRHLVTLLDIWPKFSDAKTVNKCWNSVLLHMVDFGADGGKEIIDVVKRRISNRERVSSGTIEEVFDRLALGNNHAFFAIKLALLTDVPEVRAKLLDVIKSVKCMGPSQCDEELIRLMLEKSVAADTVETLYYPRICEYLLSGECSDAEVYVHNLAMQLQDRGHMPEAGTLLLNFRGTHPALRTFGNALSSLSRWLHS